MKKLLFVCTHNSGRSQMAEAFAERLGAGRLTAQSAGTEPNGGIDPIAFAAMYEIGYDLTGQYPKALTPEMVESADVVITMGCGVDAKSCPASFAPSEDWGLEDPKGKPLAEVRVIRGQIEERVRKLIEELDLSHDEPKAG